MQTPSNEIRSEIGYLTLLLIANDWKQFGSRGAMKRRLKVLLTETHDVEVILNPHSAEAAPIPYEQEYEMCNNLDEWILKWKDWVIKHPRWVSRHPEIFTRLSS